MGSINSEEIISILKTEIENYDMVSGEQEVGSVIWVGDGIATIYGIEHAMYGEIVIFENGIRGMVQDIRRDQIGCIILGKDTEIKEGTKVTRTKKKAGVPVGNAYLGRIVNALGAPIDGKGEIPADDYRAIEQEAPGIVDRQSVNQPLETGILAIDAMFPIGRGQRELIIGDRQYLRSNRTESFYRCETCEYFDKARCIGLYGCTFCNGKRIRFPAIYCTVCGNSTGRIFHVSGKGCTDRVR